MEVVRDNLYKDIRPTKEGVLKQIAEVGADGEAAAARGSCGQH